MIERAVQRGRPHGIGGAVLERTLTPIDREIWWSQAGSSGPAFRGRPHEVGGAVLKRTLTQIDREIWWSQAGSNRRPLQCHCSALPTELWPHAARKCTVKHWPLSIPRSRHARFDKRNRPVNARKRTLTADQPQGLIHRRRR